MATPPSPARPNEQGATPGHAIEGTVPPPKNGLGSNSNYVIAGGGVPLSGVCVEVATTQALVNNGGVLLWVRFDHLHGSQVAERAERAPELCPGPWDGGDVQLRLRLALGAGPDLAHCARFLYEPHERYLSRGVRRRGFVRFVNEHATGCAADTPAGTKAGSDPYTLPCLSNP